MSGSFEKDSLDWQLQLSQTRLGEWWQRLLQRPPDQKQSGWWFPNWWLPEWSQLEWWFRAAFWTIALLLVAWALWQLYSILSPYFGVDMLALRGQRVQTKTAETLQAAQWLQRSRSFAQAGNYREACRALYQAALQKLDETGIIPTQLSRTDGEYLRILQTLTNPRPYQVLIRTHERLCFSSTDITEDTFERCEQAYRELETP